VIRRRGHGRTRNRESRVVPNQVALMKPVRQRETRPRVIAKGRRENVGVGWVQGRKNDLGKKN